MSRMYVSLVERYPVARPCTNSESATRCGLRTLRRRVGLIDVLPVGVGGLGRLFL